MKKSKFRIGSAVQVKEDHFYLSVNKGTVGKIVGRCRASGGVEVQLLIPRVFTFQEFELKPTKKKLKDASGEPTSGGRKSRC